MSTPFNIEACRRVPLAEATFRLLDYALDDQSLGQVYQRHRGNSIERKIAFPDLVHLIADSLLGHRGESAHRTFQQAFKDGSLGASVQAVYGKLRRLPIQLSLGLFDEASARLQALGTFERAQESGTPRPIKAIPASLAKLRVLAFDGKKVKYVAHKMKAIRGLKGSILGGKLLVVQDLATRQAVAVEALADGQAADNPLVPGAVARVRAGSDERSRLWIGDRAFCEFDSLRLLSSGGDSYAIRYAANCKFHCDSSVPMREGQDDAGRSYRDEWGRLGPSDSGVSVRKITVTRPGEQPFAIVTNLADTRQYPAVELLELYRERWGIETMFQQVVQTFALRHPIGSSPEATIFQAVLCLLLYNATLIVRDIVAAGAKRDRNEVSLIKLFDDLRRQMIGLMHMVGPDDIVALLKEQPIAGPEQLRNHLRKILGSVWSDLWEKAPTRKGQPAKRTARAYICGGHTSVDKILRGQHTEIPLETGPGIKKTNGDKRPQETKKDDV